MKRLKNKNAFAIMEVIIGTILLGIGLGTVTSIATRSLSSQSKAEYQLTASWLADGILSKVLVDGPINFQELQSNEGNFEEPFEKFRYEIDFIETDKYQPWEVTVRVLWDGPRNQSQFVEIETLILERLGEKDLLERLQEEGWIVPRAPLFPINRIERYFQDESDDSEG